MLQQAKTSRALFISLALVAGACVPAQSPTYVPTVSESARAPIADPTYSPGADPFTQQRLEMVRAHIEGAGITNDDVLRAMRAVPRHIFVPDDYIGQAYENHPLPIGYGQTISQPYIVAWMTELLELEPGDKVLEIGTGSGYQAAVLGELGFVDVFSMEIVPELALAAESRLSGLGYDEVQVRQGDGYYGWPEEAPFDAIIVTAAPDHLPAPLAQQLAQDGRLVIPIGPPGYYQSLWQFVREDGELKAYEMGGVSFVPLTGAGAQVPPAGTPAQ